MPSSIRINGRVVAASRDYRPGLIAGDAPPSGDIAQRPEDQREAGDRSVPLGMPIPADSPDSPFRAGLPYEDPHENVVYRVVTNLNVAEGWGTAAFWTARWNCDYLDILHFAQLGWLDAAIAAGSRVKRYRCRDEPRCIEWLKRKEADHWAGIAKRLEEEQKAPEPTPPKKAVSRTRSKAYDKLRKGRP